MVAEEEEEEVEAADRSDTQRKHRAKTCRSSRILTKLSVGINRRRGEREINETFELFAFLRLAKATEAREQRRDPDNVACDAETVSSEREREREGEGERERERARKREQERANERE